MLAKYLGTGKHVRWWYAGRPLIFFFSSHTRLSVKHVCVVSGVLTISGEKQFQCPLTPKDLKVSRTEESCNCLIKQTSAE